MLLIARMSDSAFSFIFWVLPSPTITFDEPETLTLRWSCILMEIAEVTVPSTTSIPHAEIRPSPLQKPPIAFIGYQSIRPCWPN